MSYYRKFGDQGILQFTLKVACKNIADFICRVAPTKRIDNLNNIIGAIDYYSTSEELLSKQSLYAIDSQEFLANLEADIYGRKCVLPLLLLLEFNEKDGSEWKDFGTVSIEHILPQNPRSYSQWCKDFTETERLYYTNKLGNLCLLGRRKNSSLGNLDYKQKLERYFKGNIGSFANTLKIYHTYPNQWTPVELRENQNRVVDILKKLFGI